MLTLKPQKLVDEIFLQCPVCQALSHGLGGVSKNGVPIFTCFKCKTEFSDTDIECKWKHITRPVRAYLCEQCKEYVSDVSSNVMVTDRFREIVCPNLHKGGIVAIDGIPISNIRDLTVGNRIVKVQSNQDWLILRFLNILATEENPTFNIIPRQGIQAYILQVKSPLGYIAFTKTPKEHGGIPVIRQIFIMVEARRKGYASELLNHFLREQCDQLDPHKKLFIIESPNEKSLALLAKMGYVKFENDHLSFIKCGAIRGF